MHHLILPAITGAILGCVGIVNILRSEIIEYENSDFVTTARSKGAPRRRLYTRHILRNASLPIAAGFAFTIVGLITGSVFIERVFSYPGMGNLFVMSIIRRDFSVANALVMMYGTLTIMGTLLSDIFMTIVDPRIRIK
jgi:peptide/nickel transport system permease protein